MSSPHNGTVGASEQALATVLPKSLVAPLVAPLSAAMTPLGLTATAVIVITALPQIVNLELYAGDDFTLQIDVTYPTGEPYDLDGAEPLSHIRPTPRPPGADVQLLGQFIPAIDGSSITLHLGSALSASLPAKCAWDVQITQNGRVTTLARGDIDMTPEVTY